MVTLREIRSRRGGAVLARNSFEMIGIRKQISITILVILFALICGVAKAAKPPRLVVNIVVSQMRYDYLQRFATNFTHTGFKRFMDDGVVFTDARYEFMQTISPATLATITTGANPSTHGVVSDRWIDYTTNSVVLLANDRSVYGLDCDAGVGQYSYVNMSVATLGDRLKEQHPESRHVTIAADPLSAVVMGGFSSDVYWLDDSRGNWISSTAYMETLPGWVKKYNGLRIPTQYLNYDWRPLHLRRQYMNSAYAELLMDDSRDLRKLSSLGESQRRGASHRSYDYQAVLATPAGNMLVTEFVKQALVNEKLGKNEDRTDILNICYDTPRYVGGKYGGESIEVEDLYYRLDRDLGDLISFIYAEVGDKNTVIVLTSDHGASDSFDYRGNPRDRFNAAQFRIIVNGFMGAQYGPGEWVIDYFDRQLYLNRDLVYNNGLSLEEVQKRVAAFVLQFHGISHVLTSTAMQNSYFSGSYAEKMQNSFYPKRSGDLTINLMPGWIEEVDGVRAAAGSMYEYDTHVPLMILGPKFFGQQVERTVNLRDLAPTMARVMKISRPIAAEGTPIHEITRLLD